MSALLKKWSAYVTRWRTIHGLSKAKFCEKAGIDRRTLRDLENQQFNTRFYSVAATADYIRKANIMEQLSSMGVQEPETYLSLIEALDALPASKRKSTVELFTRYFEMYPQHPESNEQRDK